MKVAYISQMFNGLNVLLFCCFIDLLLNNKHESIFWYGGLGRIVSKSAALTFYKWWTGTWYNMEVVKRRERTLKNGHVMAISYSIREALKIRMVELGFKYCTRKFIQQNYLKELQDCIFCMFSMWLLFRSCKSFCS